MFKILEDIDDPTIANTFDSMMLQVHIKIPKQFQSATLNHLFQMALSLSMKKRMLLVQPTDAVKYAAPQTTIALCR